jgi:hypothetical protein
VCLLRRSSFWELCLGLGEGPEPEF